MRTGMITAAVLTLGLAAVPSMVQARQPARRAEARTVRETRPVEVRHDDHRDVRTMNVVHDDHRDVHANVTERRNVRVDERVVIDRNRHWDHDRVYIPTPIATVAVNPVVGFIDTPIGINEVPPAVLNAAAQQTGGAPIVSIDWLHNGPNMYYDVHVAGSSGTIQTFRFGRRGVFFGCV